MRVAWPAPRRALLSSLWWQRYLPRRPGARALCAARRPPYAPLAPAPLDAPPPSPPPSPLRPSLPPEGGAADGHPNRLWTVPNGMTAARMALAPAVAWWILDGQLGAAGAGLFVAGALDWADGVVARRFNQGSLLGTFLDPLADKVLLACASLALGYTGLLSPVLVAVIVGRDALLVGGSFAYRAATRAPGDAFFSLASLDWRVEPSTLSKANTALQIGCVLAGVTAGAVGVPAPDALNALQLVTGGTTVLSGAGYLWQAGIGARRATAQAAAAASASGKSAPAPPRPGPRDHE